MVSKCLLCSTFFFSFSTTSFNRIDVAQWVLTIAMSPGNEKRPSVVVHDQQPSFQPRPVAAAEPGCPDAWRQRLPRTKSFGSSHTSFTGRSRFWSDGSSRRPLISAPSDFRHVQSGSSQLQSDMYPSNRQPDQRQYHGHHGEFARHGSYFRPLELSICMPNQRISPILPHFEFPRIITPPPPPAYCAERSEDVHQLSRQRSYSSMSFHIPRRHPVENSPPAVQETELPPRIPAKSRYRPRAYTAPEVDAIKERVASALIEVEILQKQIDDVIERQSLYTNSRPSTSHSMAYPMHGMLQDLLCTPRLAVHPLQCLITSTNSRRIRAYAINPGFASRCPVICPAPKC